MTELKYKIIVAGEGGVGKTSCVRRAVDNVFKGNYIGTIGVDITEKTVTDEDTGEKVSMSIFDLNGQEYFRNLRKRMFNKASGAILCFDLTKQYTFDKLKNWIDDIREELKKDPVFILLGNKLDLLEEEHGNQPVITEEEILSLAKNINAPYFQTSAKTGVGIHEVFKEMALQLLKQSKQHNP